jgi:hypothetical protein
MTECLESYVISVSSYFVTVLLIWFLCLSQNVQCPVGEYCVVIMGAPRLVGRRLIPRETYQCKPHEDDTTPAVTTHAPVSIYKTTTPAYSSGSPCFVSIWCLILEYDYVSNNNDDNNNGLNGRF